MLTIVVDSVEKYFIWIWEQRIKVRRIWVAVAQLHAPAQERVKTKQISRGDYKWPPLKWIHLN